MPFQHVAGNAMVGIKDELLPLCPDMPIQWPDTES